MPTPQFTDKQSYLEYTGQLKAALAAEHSSSKKLKYEICATLKSGQSPAAIQLQHREVHQVINDLVASLHSAKRLAAAQMKLIADSHSKRLFVCPICDSAEFHQELINHNRKEVRTWVSQKDLKRYSGFGQEFISHTCINCKWTQYVGYRFGKMKRVVPHPVTF